MQDKHIFMLEISVRIFHQLNPVHLELSDILQYQCKSHWTGSGKGPRIETTKTGKCVLYIQTVHLYLLERKECKKKKNNTQFYLQVIIKTHGKCCHPVPLNRNPGLRNKLVCLCPPYLPDPLLGDFWLFSQVKMTTKGIWVELIQNMETAMIVQLTTLTKGNFQNSLRKQQG